MGHRGDRRRFRPEGLVLEHRELLAGDVVAVPVVQGAYPIAGAQPRPVDPNDFHHMYIILLADRNLISTNISLRVNEAFQLFSLYALNQPITLPSGDQNSFGSGGPPPGALFMPAGAAPSMVDVGSIPVGSPPVPFTFENLVAQLQQNVAVALSSWHPTTFRIQPSVQQSPRSTTLAQQNLIPYANQQIAAMAQDIIAHPPTFSPDGMLLNKEPLNAVNTAYLNILNAVAEVTVHPNLFRTPGDFYVNPALDIKLPADGNPAPKAPGFYTHGPRGRLLPGARHRAPRRS